MGNVYAWLYGEFGVRVKLFFVKKKVKIGEAGIATLLQGQFPNPSYFKGYAGMHFSVLGGLVKGRLRLKVTFGDECELVDINPFTEVPIISDLSPIDGAGEVDVHGGGSGRKFRRVDIFFDIESFCSIYLGRRTICRGATQ